jgi:hypothetical protein
MTPRVCVCTRVYHDSVGSVRYVNAVCSRTAWRAVKPRTVYHVRYTELYGAQSAPQIFSTEIRVKLSSRFTLKIRRKCTVNRSHR